MSRIPIQKNATFSTVTATEPVTSYTAINPKTGAVATEYQPGLAIALHDAEPDTDLSVAIDGLCSMRVQESFNAIDRGTGVSPRYAHDLAGTDQYVSVGTSGFAIVGTSAASSIGHVPQGAWSPPPAEGVDIFIEVEIF